MYKSRYLEFHRSGRLRALVGRARERLRDCSLCPLCCGVDRLAGEVGACGAGARAGVAVAQPHFGEEPPLVAGGGSGAIFFTGCSLRCRFCQNHQISRDASPHPLGPAELAQTMIDLQERGCANINLVSPTHVVPQILEAVDAAVPLGLRLPLVYNSHGYESLETLALLNGVIDIYLPDAKYGCHRAARRLSGARAYVSCNRKTLVEMHRQVGELRLDGKGRAVRGLLVRHLVLPGDLARTGPCLARLAKDLGTDVTLSLMSQYRPAADAGALPPLDRSLEGREFCEILLARALSFEEYAEAVGAAGRLGFTDLWIQDPGSRDLWSPDFEKDDPFEGSPRPAGA